MRWMRRRRGRGIQRRKREGEEKKKNKKEEEEEEKTKKRRGQISDIPLVWAADEAVTCQSFDALAKPC